MGYTKRKKNVIEEFSYDKLFKAALNAEETVSSRPPSIRMSSFPFCPKKFMLECIEFMEGNSTWSFAGDFYCGIGTSVHSTLQKWVPIANPGHILGHWSCDHCGHWVKDSNPKNYKKRYWKPFMVDAQVGPVNCPKCGQRMTYEEFEFFLPEAPVSGHCDGIMLFDPGKILGLDITPDNYYIIDKALRDPKSEFKFPAYILEYKTAGKNAAMQRAEPKNEHRCQASMYVGAARSILAKKYGLVNLDMKGFIVKYIARDTPSIRSQDMRLEIDYENTFYHNQCNYVNIFDNAVMLKGDYRKPMWKCFPCNEVESFYDDCPYVDICNSMSKKDFVNYLKQITPLYKSVRVDNKAG